MASVNKVILVGYLGDAPKVETVPSGTKKATLSIGTTERGYTTRAGTVVPERTEWHRVVFWDRMADICERFLDRGSLVYVEGMIHTRSWDDDQGVRHYATEIAGKGLQMLDRRPGGASAGRNVQDGQEGAENEAEGDLPF